MLRIAISLLTLFAFASVYAYFIAMLGSVVLFFITADSKNLLVQISKTNWSALALGIAIVGLEFGYICIYRAGWKIGVASLVANISLACWYNVGYHTL